MADFCTLIGIKKSAYYLRLNGEYEWRLPELIKMCEHTNDLQIMYDNRSYSIVIKQI